MRPVSVKETIEAHFGQTDHTPGFQVHATKGGGLNVRRLSIGKVDDTYLTVIDAQHLANMILGAIGWLQEND